MRHNYLKHLHPSHIVFMVLITVGMLNHKLFSHYLTVSTDWFIGTFGWLVLLVTALFVGFCFFIILSPKGSIKLGKDHETPAYSFISWIAMMFAAGMGAGLVFWGAAEPLEHYLHPPPSSRHVTNVDWQARQSLALTYFHWGIHAWAIYAVAGLSIAYFSFRRNQPMVPSSPVSSNKMVAHGINTIAIIAVVFGVVGSLALGILQLSDGVMRTFDLDNTNDMIVKGAILGTLCVIYSVSASTSIGKGIKILSNINMAVAIALLLFVIMTGPTQLIMESFVSGLGDYLGNFVQLTFNMRHLSDQKEWMNDWTITYFLWWVAWAPFVGVFIARISRGRTIREFLLGVIFVPTLFSALWFAALGATAMNLPADQAELISAASQHERVTFMLLNMLPLSEITTCIALLLLFIFLVTSADSGTYVLGMFSKDGDMNPPPKERLFWGAIIGVVTVGSISSNTGIAFFKSVSVFGAIPYIFIMIWQLYGLWKAIYRDK